jgi:hypothetical protein
MLQGRNHELILKSLDDRKLSILKKGYDQEDNIRSTIYSA